MHKHIDDVEFTIFDTETTGLNWQTGDRIVEIAGLRFKGKERIAIFSSLVNPGQPVSEAAFAVNRITSQMLQSARGPKEVILQFLEFIRGSCLCSYNAEFDLGFLNNELKLISLPAVNNMVVFDLLTMAKRLIPGLSRYALWFVADKLGVKSKQEHRAFSDVEMTWEVFGKLKAICQAKGITDFTGFSGLFAFNPGLLESFNEQKASKIRECIDLKATLKIRYLSTHSAEVTERQVIPKEIKQDRMHKYLVGYCCLKKEERTFRIDNILSLEIT
jgi:DNA polymerase III epsilon subunit family exonuclease